MWTWSGLGRTEISVSRARYSAGTAAWSAVLRRILRSYSSADGKGRRIDDQCLTHEAGEGAIAHAVVTLVLVTRTVVVDESAFTKAAAQVKRQNAKWFLTLK